MRILTYANSKILKNQSVFPVPQKLYNDVKSDATYILGTNIERIWVLLSFIYNQNLYRKRNNLDLNQPIHLDELRYLFGSKWNSIKKILIDDDILIQTKYYKVNCFAKGYKLNDKYLTNEFVNITISNKTLLKRFKQPIKRIKNKGMSITKIVKDNYSQCDWDLSNMPSDMIEEYTEIINNPKTRVDNKVNRCFHPLTKDKLLRTCLRYKGDKYLMLDFHASHPMLYFSMMEPRFHSPREIKDIQLLISNNEFYNTLMRLVNTEIKNFNKTHPKITLLYKEFKDLNRFKKNLLSAFNGKFQKYNWLIVSVMKDLFPNYWNGIEELKKYDHKKLSQLTMLFESSLLEDCLRDLTDEFDIPMFPIFDCLLVPSSYVEVISERMIKFYNEELEFIEVKLNIKPIEENKPVEELELINDLNLNVQ